MTTHGRPSFAPLFLEPFDLPNPEVRDVARGKAGVYVLRQRGIVRYVGSSVPEEKGGAREPLRLWKTVLRHFQRCKGAAAGRYGFGDDNFCTHDRNEWEIAIFDTHASDARKIEQNLIEHYKPTDQPKHTSDKRKARKENAGGRRKRNPAAADDAARKKNPPKRPKKVRTKKRQNPADDAEDRRIAYRFLKFATGGHVESMRSACKDEDPNGNFDDATAEELAEILATWAKEVLT
jgi:hypothetical protein